MPIWSTLAQKLRLQIDKPYIPGPRAHPDGSWVELAKRKKEVGQELRARLYLYEEKLILCPVAGIAEVEDPMVLQADVASSELGLSICDHLLRFRPQTPPLRDRKRTDWKAYQVSGARSVRAFQEKAWFAHIATVATGITVNAGPCNSLHQELTVQGTANHGPHEEIGDVLRRTLKAAWILRDNGVI